MAAWSLALLRGPASAAVKTVCGLDDAGGCSALWRSPFALAVHRGTGVSVAGWGVVWGAAAVALALLALVRVTRGQPWSAAVTALRCLSAAGFLGVFVLAAVALAERTFCAGCALAYALAAGHAALALFAWRDRGLPEAARGLMLAAACLLCGYLVVVFVPGSGPRETALAPAAIPTDRPADEALQGYVASLAPDARQALSDALGQMRRGPSLALPPPRALRGPAEAPVRFTEFTDVRCSHCAELHAVWEELEKALPPGSFSVEPRFFPLESECNPLVRARGRVLDPVRCLAPLVQICLEDQAAASLAGALFAEQRTLTTERVYAIAAPYDPRGTLPACVASEATAARLADDVALAARYRPRGTPIVLVNGRVGSALPQFLYAIVLARGSPDHPAFGGLPAPDPHAEIP
jgi:protein-disulfide isomerase